MSERALRDELAAVLVGLPPTAVYSDGTIKIVAEPVVDALMPVVRRAVEQARADERERLADAILANGSLVKPEHEHGCPACAAARCAASYIRSLEQ